MKKKLKELPKLETEVEEREFWWTHDSTEYIDWDSAKFVVFPNLKPTAQAEEHAFGRSGLPRRSEESR